MSEEILIMIHTQLICLKIPLHTVAVGVCLPCYLQETEQQINKKTVAPQSVCIYNNYCLQLDCNSHSLSPGAAVIS